MMFDKNANTSYEYGDLVTLLNQDEICILLNEVKDIQSRDSWAVRNGYMLVRILRKNGLIEIISSYFFKKA